MIDNPSSNTSEHAINLPENPHVYVFGAETGGTLELRFVKPSEQTASSMSASEIRVSAEHNFSSPEQLVDHQWTPSELGNTIIVLGDGNVIGNNSRACVTKL